MQDIQSYGSFLAAIIVFQVVPGAGTVAILNATARNGMTAGMGAVLGTLLGDFLFMCAAMAGLAAVMAANPALFHGMQWFGAAYLCWLGIRLLRGGGDGGVAAEEPVRSPGSYFRQACAVSLTNPKVILFFVAFFPPFLRPEASPMTLALMMAHVTLISLAYQTLLVLIGNAAAVRLRRIPSVRRIGACLAGTALIAFGVKVAVNAR